MDAGLDAAAHTLRAARAVEGGVLSVPQALHLMRNELLDLTDSIGFSGEAFQQYTESLQR